MTTVEGPQYEGDPRKFVKWIDDEGQLQFDFVDISDISFKGRFGVLTRSDTQNDVSIGNKEFYLDVPANIKIGDDVRITCLNNFDLNMWGEVSDIIATGTTPDGIEGASAIEVYIDDVPPFTDEDQTNWELQVVARPKPGIEKDVSLSSVDPTGAGPFTFEITAGKFFPIGGQLLIKPLSNRKIALLGRVLAYDDTTLIVALNETNATVSESYDSWSIALLDAPPADLPEVGISGLVASIDTLNQLVVTAGSVMDSTGTVLLTLDEDITKSLDLFDEGFGVGSVVRVPMTGTISSSGAPAVNITGTGTNFRGELVNNGGLALMNEFEKVGAFFTDQIGGTVPVYTMLSTDDGVGKGVIVAQVSSDTSATSLSNGITLGASGDNFYRGCTYTGATNLVTGTAGGFMGFVTVIRRDTDGVIDVCVSAGTASGEPDVPAGYSFYRVIAGLYRRTTNFDWEIVHHLHKASAPFASAQSRFVVPVTDPFLPNSYVWSGSTSIAAVTTVSPNRVSAWRSALAGDVAAPLNDNTTTAQPAMITGKTEKTTLVDDDLFLIADSEASFALKKVKNINAGGGGGGGGGIPTDWGLITDPIDAEEILDFGTLV